MAVLAGLVLGAASAGLLRLIIGDWWWALPLGTLLGSLVVQQVWQGSGVRVLADGTLIYALRGADCLSVPLVACGSPEFIQSGALSGVLLPVPPAAVTFLSRKGPSRSMVESWGGVVLESLTAEDAHALTALWAAACAAEEHVAEARVAVASATT